MKKFLPLLFFFASLVIKAQIFSGYEFSNYSGLNGIIINPANAADNRLKADFTFVGLDFGLENNYIGIKRKPLLNREMFHYKGNDFKGAYMKEFINDKNKNLIINVDAVLPSFFLSLTNKIGIGFLWRARTIVNINQVSPELAKLSYESLDYPALWQLKLDDNNLRISSMSWAEYGAVFAMTVKDDGKHFVKAGGTVKLLQGLEAAYMYADNLSYNFTNDTLLTLYASNMEYGHSTNFEYNQSGLSYKFVGKPSIGLDLGVVYEYRPDYLKYTYKSPTGGNLPMKNKNKYLFKVGLSVIDIGRIKFERGPLSRKFYADIVEWDINHFKAPNIDAFDDTINTRFHLAHTEKELFKVTLPTAIVAQFDYHIWKSFYANFSPFLTWEKAVKKNQTRYLTRVTLTPRWDWTWAGAAIPISYSEMGDVNVGLSVRVGPLIVGSNNVGNLLLKEYIKGINMYALLKVPIPFGNPPKDTDKDGIPDKEDKCPEVAGILEFKGCPDRDGDHVADDKDACPDVPGLAALNGCPDKDGDGITDLQDNCPDVPGLKDLMGCPDKDGDGITDLADACPDQAGPKEFNGCPDKDGDGLPDNTDQCPDKAGPKEFNGCPDTDSDGLPDNKDSCPNEAGPKENNGCPYGDRDKDGILDKDDHCPEVAGPVENFGCPWSDTDGDGVTDNVDQCPLTPGPAANNGCPEIKQVDKLALQKAFDNLEFETGKSIIKQESYSSLNELVTVLKNNPDYVLTLSGHTDNVGTHESNIELSKNRANSVKQFLVDKGIDGARITTEWFGPDKPIADNSTPQGRQKNRRVEMKLNYK